MKEHYKQNSLQLAYYKQTVNKNAMLRQTVPSIDKIYQQDFLKGRPLPFHRTFCTQLTISRASANKHFVRSIKIYQCRFHKVINLKHSTRVAMRSAFCRMPCTQPSISKNSAEMQCSSKLFQILAKCLSKTFPKQLL